MVIDKFLQRAESLGVNIDSIVYEENGSIQKTIINDIALHDLKSCSKLLVAFAYGIIIAEEWKCKYSEEIITLGTKLYPTLSAIYKGHIPEQVKEWDIKTLLTHSTGYEKMMFNEKHIEGLDKNNLLQVLFDTDIKYATHEHFTYSNVEPYLLSIFFQENFGQNLSDFVRDRIFVPCGITNFRWVNLGKYCAGATGLALNYNDFHKLGQLMMNGGKFDGKQVVPENWIKEMTTKQVSCPDYYKPERVLPKESAGYFTWISRDNIVFRDGKFGQYIICDFKSDRLITIMSTEENMKLVTECLKNLI